MASEFSTKYGDKFADGSRTLKYAKVSEPVYVTDHEELRDEFKEFKQDTNNNINSLDAKLEAKINNLGIETARIINELRHDVNTDMRIMNEHLHTDDVKLNMIWQVIFAIMQTWPMRFLNFFKWWTYKVIDYSAFRDPDTGEVTIYVMPIIRGPKTRKEQITFEKEYKNKIKDIKKYFTEKTNGTVKLKYTFKPICPDIR